MIVVLFNRKFNSNKIHLSAIYNKLSRYISEVQKKSPMWFQNIFQHNEVLTTTNIVAEIKKKKQVIIHDRSTSILAKRINYDGMELKLSH